MIQEGQQKIIEGQALINEFCKSAALAKGPEPSELLEVPQFKSQQKKRKVKAEKKERKKHTTGYMLFCNERRPHLDMAPNEKMSALGKEWGALTKEQKNVYLQKAKALNDETDKAAVSDGSASPVPAPQQQAAPVPTPAPQEPASPPTSVKNSPVVAKAAVKKTETPVAPVPSTVAAATADTSAEEKKQKKKHKKRKNKEQKNKEEQTPVVAFA